MKLRQRYKLLKKKLEATYTNPVIVKNVYADIERYSANLFTLPCSLYAEESEKLKYLEQAFCDEFRTYIIKNMKIKKVATINTFPYGMYPYKEEYRAEIMMINCNKID